MASTTMLMKTDALQDIVRIDASFFALSLPMQKLQAEGGER